MIGIVLAVVIFVLVLVGAVRIAYQRRHRADDVSVREVSGAAPIGYLPGYMPGIQQKAQRRDDPATELVEPPHGRSSVDLDSGVLHVRRAG